MITKVCGLKTGIAMGNTQNKIENGKFKSVIKNNISSKSRYYGDSENEAIESVKNSMLVMLGAIGIIMGCLVVSGLNGLKK